MNLPTWLACLFDRTFEEERLIGPRLIKAAYTAVQALAALIAISLVVLAFRADQGTLGIALLFGAILLPLTLLAVVRVACELTLRHFR